MAVIEAARATHTTLEVASVDRAIRFYRDVLGLRTHRNGPRSGHFVDPRGQYAAFLELRKRVPQPFLNFYARPVPDAAAVDAIHARLSAERAAWEIAELTAPAREDPAKFGVSTYGFYLRDADANWWRIEENAGPFGPVEIPTDAEPRGAIVPAGPVSYVTLECRDLGQTMGFYREFLGIDVEQRAPHYFFTRGNGGVCAIVVERGDALVEQTLQNHHGITLWTDEGKIDELRAAAVARRDELGIRQIKKAINQHGSYSFYMQDQDTNWWEIEVWAGHVDPWTRSELRQAAARAAAESAPAAVGVD
jgi:catechol 2,3-dioxygenase-like lactoylglutathione lyase family enzyme